jgi:hypothetical protein
MCIYVKLVGRWNVVADVQTTWLYLWNANIYHRAMQVSVITHDASKGTCTVVSDALMRDRDQGRS